jgi:peptide deformylase
LVASDFRQSIFFEDAVGTRFAHREGNASVPGVNDEVERHARIRLRYQDVYGNMHTEESDGLRTVCHQHEIDKLNGQFWINRLSRLKRERPVKRFERVSRR